MSEIVLPANLTDCHALIRQLLTIIEHDHRQQEALASKVGEMEARLNQNSRNSSRPPSSNFGKNTPKQTIQPGIPKEIKPQGGQKDHTGHTLHKIEHCNPHLLRELTYQKEQGKLWATQIHDFLLDIYKRTEKGTTAIENIQIVKAQWQKICQDAIILEEILLAQRTKLSELTLFDQPKKRGRKPRGKPLTLLDRLLLHTDAILAFAEFQAVPFSNNQAERDIRPIKTKLKVAGCFRTTDGANRYARIQGFISTCRKQNINVFNELKKLAEKPLLYIAPFKC